jgi:hypothetical protein
VRQCSVANQGRSTKSGSIRRPLGGLEARGLYDGTPANCLKNMLTTHPKGSRIQKASAWGNRQASPQRGATGAGATHIAKMLCAVGGPTAHEYADGAPNSGHDFRGIGQRVPQRPMAAPGATHRPMASVGVGGPSSMRCVTDSFRFRCSDRRQNVESRKAVEDCEKEIDHWCVPRFDEAIQ